MVKVLFAFYSILKLEFPIAASLENRSLLVCFGLTLIFVLVILLTGIILLTVSVFFFTSCIPIKKTNSNNKLENKLSEID